MARTGAAMVMFEVVGSFQASNMLKDAKAQMNILNAIVLNGLGGVFDAATDAAKQIASLVDATVPLAVEIAEARIQFDKFMGSADNLDDVRKEVIAIGTSFGFTADKSLEAGAKMAQLKDIIGGSASVGAATEVGIKFALIGDMETQDAMQKLINLQQQTNFMFKGMTAAQIEAMDAQSRSMLVHKNSMQVLTQLNTVENNSAANMQQLTFIMNQFAAQADMTGESIADMAASAAVLVESGEEMGKAGRALRMIYARLGANTQDNNTELEKFGITVKDVETGALRPLSDIVSDLADNFHKLTAGEQQQISQLIAGNDHYVRFIKLVQGAERQQTLSTMANLGLADAQEEVNLRLEDQATSLRIVEAELHNAKGALGDALIPAQIAATKSQLSYNRALETFYTMSGTNTEKSFGSLVRFLMDSSFHFERLHKVMGPVLEAMLNMKSLSVAIATQETIMRSMSGEQLMNPAFYKNVAGHQNNITQDTIREYQIRLRMSGARTAAFSVAQLEGDLTDRQTEQMLQQLKIASIRNQQGINLNEIESERFNVYQQLTNSDQRLLGIKQKANNEARSAIDIIRAEAAMKNMLNAKELAILEARIPIEREILFNHASQLKIAQNSLLVGQSMGDVGRQEVRVNSSNLNILKHIAQHYTTESEERIQAMLTEGRILQIRKDHLKMAQAEMEIAHLKASEPDSERYKELVQEVAQTRLLNMEQMTQSQLQDHLNNLNAEELLILNNLGLAQSNYNLLTEQETQLLTKLIPLMQTMNVTNQETAEILFDTVRAEMAHSDSMKATGIQASETSLSMMKMSAGLGAASMAVSMFDDSTQGAKVSMMLMSPVMIMSTIEMIKMTSAMIKQTQVQVGNTVTTVANASAHGGLAAAIGASASAVRAFLVAAGPIALVIGAATYALYKLTDSAEDNADSVIRMNGALSDSVNILTDLQNMSIDDLLGEVPQSVAMAAQAAGIDLGAVINMSQAELQATMDLTMGKIKELTELADDGSSVVERAYMQELEAANKYLGALEAQNVLLRANAVLAGDAATAQDVAASTALANARNAAQQFGENQNFINLYDEIGFFGGGTREYISASQNSGYETASAFFKAFEMQSEQEFSNAKLEDYIEALTANSGGYRAAVADIGLTNEEMEAFESFRDEVGLTGRTLEMLVKSLDDTGDATDETVKAISDGMDDMDFSPTVEQAELLKSILGGLGDDAAAGISGAGDSLAGELAGMNEQLVEFNNNREAMFFGFSQSGATGEFVKQVQQKGVENLIANTELIVTNNFNGMSLPEMVAKVTDGVVEMLVNAGVVQEGAVQQG